MASAMASAMTPASSIASPSAIASAVVFASAGASAMASASATMYQLEHWPCYQQWFLRLQWCLHRRVAGDSTVAHIAF